MKEKDLHKTYSRQSHHSHVFTASKREGGQQRSQKRRKKVLLHNWIMSKTPITAITFITSEGTFRSDTLETQAHESHKLRNFVGSFCEPFLGEKKIFKNKVRSIKNAQNEYFNKPDMTILSASGSMPYTGSWSCYFVNWGPVEEKLCRYKLV